MSEELSKEIAEELGWTDFRRSSMEYVPVWSGWYGKNPGTGAVEPVPYYHGDLNLIMELWGKEQFLWVQLNREQPTPCTVIWEAIAYNQDDLEYKVRVAQEERFGGSPARVLALAWLEMKESNSNRDVNHDKSNAPMIWDILESEQDKLNQ